MDSRKSIFEKYVPQQAIDYCYQLWINHNFELRISKSRNSKLGDYKFEFASRKHSISINHDLNRYSFLITYIHEVAHKITFEKHLNQVSPHGKEWKHQFKSLMLPLLKEDIFPMDILAPLALHMKNPKASSVRDSNLAAALKSYDKKTNLILLKDIALGQRFLFRKKTFLKLEIKRTRSVCEQVESGKRYLIAESAEVSGYKN